jgi:hypothetical protein
VWPSISAGLTQLMTQLNEGFPRKQWMALYADVYDYCTTARAADIAKSKEMGAKLVGKELYARLQVFFAEHMFKIQKVRSPLLLLVAKQPNFGAPCFLCLIQINSCRLLFIFILNAAILLFCKNAVNFDIVACRTAYGRVSLAFCKHW